MERLFSFQPTHGRSKPAIGHRTAIINQGKIAAIDTPENLRAQSVELQYIEALFDKQVNIEEISKSPNISKASFAGNKVRVYTANPSAVIEFLVEFAKQKRLRILSLNTMMPSLEDVFIKLIKEKEATV
ncbi:MAG: hypothetical protein QME50_01770 [Candidatus Bathyarchaeota archaeon]|nr:hypothetical protein [Candidatus Bathyarchaeota archaeon]